MSYSLSDIVDKIGSYDKIYKDFGFNPAGHGIRPWSFKYINSADEVLNVRSRDWVLFSSEDKVIAEGNTPAELKHFLLDRMTHEELVKFANER